MTRIVPSKNSMYLARTAIQIASFSVRASSRSSVRARLECRLEFVPPRLLSALTTAQKRESVSPGNIRLSTSGKEASMDVEEVAKANQRMVATKALLDAKLMEYLAQGILQSGQ